MGRDWEDVMTPVENLMYDLGHFLTSEPLFSSSHLGKGRSFIGDFRNRFQANDCQLILFPPSPAAPGGVLYL